LHVLDVDAIAGHSLAIHGETERRCPGHLIFLHISGSGDAQQNAFNLNDFVPDEDATVTF
jgi:hypothetical protein